MRSYLFFSVSHFKTLALKFKQVRLFKILVNVFYLVLILLVISVSFQIGILMSISIS